MTWKNVLALGKARKKANIRNRYNQVPHLTQDTTRESDKITIKQYIQDSQQVSSFPAGVYKAAIFLFDLILYVPSTIFQLKRDRSSWTSTKLGSMCFAQGHNAVTLVRVEPATPRSRDKHSTTEPLHSPGLQWTNKKTWQTRKINNKNGPEKKHPLEMVSKNTFTRGLKLR